MPVATPKPEAIVPLCDRGRQQCCASLDGGSFSSEEDMVGAVMQRPRGVVKTYYRIADLKVKPIKLGWYL
jgi:hypothetical protein